MKKALIIGSIVLGVIILALGGLFIYFRIKESANKNNTENTSENIPAPKNNSLPVIKNIGIKLDAYNPATGMAGDVKFEKINSQYWDSLMFEHFGYKMKPTSATPNPGLNVHPEYLLPKGTKIFSVSDGVVDDVKIIYSGDYSVLVTQEGAPGWILNYEHVINPQVKKGDKIVAGQPIAEVSTLQTGSISPNYGKWALSVFKGAEKPEDIVTYCPYLLFDESVKAEMQAKITRFITEWEQFIGQNVYDEEKWLAPGCAAETLKENN